MYYSIPKQYDQASNQLACWGFARHQRGKPSLRLLETRSQLFTQAFVVEDSAHSRPCRDFSQQLAKHDYELDRHTNDNRVPVFGSDVNSKSPPIERALSRMIEIPIPFPSIPSTSKPHPSSTISRHTS